MTAIVSSNRAMGKITLARLRLIRRTDARGLVFRTWTDKRVDGTRRVKMVCMTEPKARKLRAVLRRAGVKCELRVPAYDRHRPFGLPARPFVIVRGVR